MSESFLDSTQLHLWVRRIQAGDRSASDELLRATGERLERLTRKMLRRFPSVRRWEQSDDVLQNALLRLLRALQAVAPQGVADYFRLAARQIRRELIDLARHYYGPEGPGAHHASRGPDTASGDTPEPLAARADSSDEPGRLAAWAEFHERAAALPEPAREVFELLWYHGLTQAEAAEVLHISVPTVKRRWLDARLDLQESLRGEMPPP